MIFSTLLNKSKVLPLHNKKWFAELIIVRHTSGSLIPSSANQSIHGTFHSALQAGNRRDDCFFTMLNKSKVLPLHNKKRFAELIIVRHTNGSLIPSSANQNIHGIFHSAWEAANRRDDCCCCFTLLNKRKVLPLHNKKRFAEISIVSHTGDGYIASLANQNTHCSLHSARQKKRQQTGARNLST